MQAAPPWLPGQPAEAGEPMNAAAFVLERSAATPDAIAVETLSRRVCFRDLYVRVAQCAAGLRALGVGRGARVVLVGADTPDYLALVLGAIAAGAVAVPV